MTNDELRELREWAAGVCGKNLVQRHPDLPLEWAADNGGFYLWEPDQNIVQAFEVLEVFREQGWFWCLKRMPDAHAFIVQGSRSEYDAPCPDSELEGSQGKSVCELNWMGDEWRHNQYGFATEPALAVLFACKSAWEAEQAAINRLAQRGLE